MRRKQNLQNSKNKNQIQLHDFAMADFDRYIESIQKQKNNEHQVVQEETTASLSLPRYDSTNESTPLVSRENSFKGNLEEEEELRLHHFFDFDLYFDVCF